MPHEPLRTALRHLRRTLGAEAARGVTDAQLLERFVTQRDESAFELLVWRHERLVLGVCRRVLHNAHDAEDAFQATFLVLVRKAGSIGKRQSLASWLYKVAYRTALTQRARRARGPQPTAELPAVAVPDEASEEAAQREVYRVLDQEVSRLPEKYRVPVVLCYLEGKAYAEAAREIGCPKGTVSIRLTRARALLRHRLARRGVTLPAGLLAVGAAGQAAAGPAALVDATVQAGLKVAAGPTAAGGVSAPVAALTEGVLRVMFLTKLKIAAVVLAVGMTAGGGAGLLTIRLWAGAPQDMPAVLAPGSLPAPAQAAPPPLAGGAEEPDPSETWVERATLRGHQHAVLCVAFSPDGKTLASGAGDAAGQPGELRLWDVATGREWHVHELPHAVMGLAFAPDGQTLASAGADRTVALWETARGQVRITFRAQGHGNRVSAVVFAPDGQTLATGSLDRTVRLWEVATGKEVRLFQGHTDTVQGVAFSPDGRRLLSGSNDRTVKVWDAATGRELLILRHQGAVKSVAFAPDGRMLATAGGDGAVRLWDTTTGQQVRALAERRVPVLSVAFSPDGKVLAVAVGGWDAATEPRRDAEVKLLDVGTGQLLATLRGHTDPVVAVVFSPDGRLLATASWDGTIKLWERQQTSRLRTRPGPPAATSFLNELPQARAKDRLEQLLQALLEAGKTDEQVLEALYLATLARLPTAGEKKSGTDHVARQQDRRAAFANVLWALTQSKEFSANLEALGQRDPRRTSR
jgi:RNA polymerase sigma factor (sigma-70 family)